MMKHRIIVSIGLSLLPMVFYGKWKLGAITNQTKDLTLEAAWYGKGKKTAITHLTTLLSGALPVTQPGLAKPVLFNSMVSTRSNGCCMITAQQGKVKYRISFDDYASLAIKQNRKKTQMKVAKQCVGTNACDHTKFDYCARVFIELLSSDNEWRSVYCNAQGYSLKPGEPYVTFNLLLSEVHGVYIAKLVQVT